MFSLVCMTVCAASESKQEGSKTPLVAVSAASAGVGIVLAAVVGTFYAKQQTKEWERDEDDEFLYGDYTE